MKKGRLPTIQRTINDANCLGKWLFLLTTPLFLLFSLSLYFDSASAKKYIGSVTNRRFFSLAYRHVKNNHKNGQIFSINKICPIALVAFVCTEIGLTGFILLFLLNERASERTSADNDAPLFDFDENYYSIKALSK